MSGSSPGQHFVADSNREKKSLRGEHSVYLFIEELKIMNRDEEKTIFLGNSH